MGFYTGWTLDVRLRQDDKEGIQSLYGQPGAKEPPTENKPTLNCPLENIPTLDFPPENRQRFGFPTNNRPTVNFPGSRPTIAARPKEKADLCGSKIDAIVETSDRSSYVFRGPSYWLLTEEGVAPGYPRQISQDWAGLPGDIDAALT